MDARTKLRLLLGPVRPFIMGKLRDAVMRPLKRRRALAMLRTTPTDASPLRRGVIPLPPAEWIANHGDEETKTAIDMAAGRFRGFGIDTWDRDLCTVNAPDPRGMLEFARLHHLPAYAIAAAHSAGHDEGRWFAEFTRDIRSFRANHPPMNGPLWSVAMDCGIRLFNILMAWDWFGQLGYSDSELDNTIAVIVAEHEIVINATLETSGGMGTSHLLGGLLGLLAVEAYRAQRAVSSGLKPAVSIAAMFTHEVDRQILSDGMSFEASTGYHRQVVDILVHAEMLIRQTPHLLADAPPQLFEKIALAVEAQRELERAGMPLIGDNDDGVVVKGGRMEGWKDGRVEGRNSERVVFGEFGLWIWHLDDAVLTARNGPVGQYGKGGHAHNDQNSITLRIEGHPVIIDPGSYCYVSDPRRRNYDRSTAAHATVDLGVEQRWWPDDAGEGLFWMLEAGRRPHVDIATDRQWQARVWHQGKPSVLHERRLDIGEQMIRITDIISADAPSRTRRIMIPLGPEVHAEVSHRTATLTFHGHTVHVSWSDASPELTTMNMAPAYFENVVTQCLVLHMERNDVEWTLRW